MKFIPILSLVTLFISTPVLSDLAGLAVANSTHPVLAQAIKPKPQVKLMLSADKKVVQKDAQGKETVSWQSVQDKATVQPGDIVRWTINIKNEGSGAAEKLILPQPLPKGMTYMLNSANVSAGKGTITYSIDGGKTYVAKPTIQVKLPDGKVETRPAPAERYTHIRWALDQAIAPKQAVSVSYQAQVRKF
jgi:uncharacterized repeat protein (TIGR01451 family)